MKPSDLPVVSVVFEAGAEDRVFDSLLLVGPLVIVLVAVLGRSLLTTGLAMGYIAVFVTYVLYRGARQDSGPVPARQR